MTLADVALAEPRDLETGLTREWLVTNGLGGYASGTVVGVNTRRYHGLLIAAVHPPVQRTDLLVRLDDVLTVNDRPVDLMAAEYEDGTIFPQGYTHLAEFELEDGVPTWLYAVDGALLRRSIWMVPGRNITAIRYKLVAGTAPVGLALRPLTAARDHHAVQHGNPGWRFAAEAVPDGVRVQATPDSPSLWLLARGADYIPGGDWYWKYLLRQERDRGYDHIEDLYQPGTFRASLEPGQSLTLIASADDPAAGLPDLDVALSQVRGTSDHAAATAAGRSYPAATVDTLAAVRELSTGLAEAAGAFIVRRAAGPGSVAPTSIIAGYHWFADWGRDAMIGLPGLLLLTGPRRAGRLAAPHLRRQHRPGDDPQSVPGHRRGRGIQHRRRHPLVLPGPAGHPGRHGRRWAAGRAVAAPDGDRGVAPARHPLRDRRRSAGRPAPRRRERRAGRHPRHPAHLDGRPRGRHGLHPTDRQAGGDQCAVGCCALADG